MENIYRISIYIFFIANAFGISLASAHITDIVTFENPDSQKQQIIICLPTDEHGYEACTNEEFQNTLSALPTKNTHILFESFPGYDLMLIVRRHCLAYELCDTRSESDKYALAQIKDYPFIIHDHIYDYGYCPESSNIVPEIHEQEYLDALEERKSLYAKAIRSDIYYADLHTLQEKNSYCIEYLRKARRNKNQSERNYICDKNMISPYAAPVAVDGLLSSLFRYLKLHEGFQEFAQNIIEEQSMFIDFTLTQKVFNALETKNIIVVHASKQRIQTLQTIFNEKRWPIAHNISATKLLTIIASYPDHNIMQPVTAVAATTVPEKKEDCASVVAQPVVTPNVQPQQSQWWQRWLKPACMWAIVIGGLWWVRSYYQQNNVG